VASAYLEFIRIRFLTMLAYRVNYYSGIVIYSLNIGVYYFLWKAIYGDASQLGGFSAAQITTYVAVSWMARSFYFNNLDREIANEIRDGSVAIQMIRPYSYLLVKFMQGFGEGLFRLVMFMLPGLVVVMLLFPLDLPKEPWRWAVFFLMILFSFLINSQINLLTGMIAFWLENNQGVISFKRVMVDLFSGVVLPISFFPGWARTVLEWLPFQAIAYLPGSAFTGTLSGSEVVFAIGIQAVWSVALILPIMLMWRAARRRMFVQGG